MHYLLIGLGVSNLAIAEHLLSKNTPFSVYVDNPNFVSSNLPHSTNYFYDLDSTPLDTITHIIKSPGIPNDHPLLIQSKHLSIPILNDVSFSLPFVNQPLIGITGSNGKTTVTKLVAHILSDLNAQAVGNVGSSFAKKAIYSNSPLVTELSSFQLENLTSFNPDVSVFLNFQPTHLDHHKTIKNYLEAKKNVFNSQDVNLPFVYNLDDPIVNELASIRGGNTYSFSLVDKDASAYFDGFSFFLFGNLVFDKNIIPLIGNHNYANVLAATLVCYDLVSIETIIEKISSFVSVAHRLEKLSVEAPFSIYNDSKSTNPASTLSAVSSFSEPIILLLGGKDRGNDFSNLLSAKDSIKHIFLFGETGPSLSTAFKNSIPSTLHSSLGDAVDDAILFCEPDDQLVFSPGCASWDTFKNYEERGDWFKEKMSNTIFLNKEKQT